MTCFIITYYYMQLFSAICPGILGKGHITNKNGHIGPRVARI